MIQRLHELSSRRPALVSGVLGALVAVLFFPTWQHAVESGQVLAGVVAYPDHDNPFYVYHRYSPSLLNHLASWLILATDEIVTCLTFSALQGGFSYLALGVMLQVFIKTGRHLIPLVVLCAHLSGIMELPMPYPMEIAGSVGYGAFAQALFLLSGALYATGRYRWMLFNLLFVTPLIHPTVGLLAVATVFLAHCVSTWFSRRRILPRFADDSRGYLFAALMCLAAFVALTLLFYPSRPYTSFDSTTINITRQFLNYWSNHHEDFPFVSLVGLTCLVFTSAVCLLALLDRETKPLGESRAWFFLVAAASIALMGAILSWMPISWTWIPISFWQSMPLRWPNLVMSPIPAIALVILLARGKTRIVGILLLIAGIAGVGSLGLNSDDQSFLGMNDWIYNGKTALHHFVAIVIVRSAVFFEFAARDKTSSLSDRILGPFRGRKQGLVLSGDRTLSARMDRFIITLSILLVVVSFHHIVAPTAHGSMWTWQSEKGFYQKVHDAIGPDEYLLSAGELSQLKAGVPVFTNLAFNQALYLPSTWEGLLTGYREVYGTDLDDLYVRSGTLSHKKFLNQWMHRTISEWNMVAKENSIGALISATPLPFQFDTRLSVGSGKEAWLYQFPISGPSVIQTGGD